jgi:molybdopterin-containing oxidoreductase family molybdopterin binding subunit
MTDATRAVERTQVTVCSPNCYDQNCPLAVTVRDGKITGIAKVSFPDRPYVERICLKGLARRDWVYAPDRLREPLRRTGPRGSGEFEPISWSEALDAVAGAMRDGIERHGPRSLGLLGSFGAGNALSPWRRLASALGATVILGGIDQGIPWADRAMLGGASDPPYEGGEATRLIILWGNNMVETAPGMSHFLFEARERGARIVAIDPRFSPTAAHADLYIPIEPGSDAALALSMAHVILREGLEDRGYLARHSAAPLLVREDDGRYLRLPGDAGETFAVFDLRSGRVVPPEEASEPALEGTFPFQGVVVRPSLELLRQRVQGFAPSAASEITRVPAETIERLARAYATEKPAVIRPGYGVERWTNGDQSAMAIYTLPILTGSVGVPGGGVGRSTSSWPVELGAWPPPPGEDLRDVGYLGPMRALDEDSPVRTWLVLGNPLQQWFPDFGHTERVLSDPARTDFVACVDLFMTTSARYADIVLPACSFFEKDDLLTLPFSYIGLQQKLIEPLYSSRSDFEIYRAIAEGLGVGQWFEESPETVMERMLAGGDERVRRVSLARLRREGVVRLEVPDEPPVPHQDGVYKTPTGRAQFYLEELAPYGCAVADYLPPELPTSQEFPLRLQSAHTRFRTHSTYANVPSLLAIDPWPLVELSPGDAQARGIADGDWALVRSAAGEAVLRAKVTPGQRQGSVRIANGWWNAQFRRGSLQHLTARHRSPRQEAIYQDEGRPMGWVFGTTAPFYEQACEVRRLEEGEIDG